jgi:hypothetical protein
MVIAAGDALFIEPSRTARAPSTASILSSENTMERQEIVTGAILAAADTAVPGGETLGTAEPLALAPAAVAPPAEPASLRLGRYVGVVADVSPAEATALSTDDAKEFDVAASSAAGRGQVEVAALSAADRITETASTARAAEEPEGASPWVNAAVACPRDWLDGAGPEFTTDLSADCEPKFVLVAPAPLPDVEEAAPAEPALDEALESVAATEALKLAGFVARLPAPRPDPPPVRKVRSDRRADWPAAPPPNCSPLHAYWRFVDRETGAKEWYCR